MNQVNEDLVRAIVKVLQSSDLPDGSGSVSVGYDVETDFDSESECDYECSDCLQDRIDELEEEIAVLKDEIAERDMYDLIIENEELCKEVEELRDDNLKNRLMFNKHIDRAIDLLKDEKYVI